MSLYDDVFFLTGFFPSPIYFGAIINATCIYWQYTCGERGACWIYDIIRYRFSYFGTLLVLRVLGLCCYVVVFLSIKPEVIYVQIIFKLS